MRRGGMFRNVREAFGSSARNETESLGSKGKPDDRPTWPAAPSGAKGRGRRAYVSGLPVPRLRHGFSLGWTGAWKQRRLSLPRWRRGDRGPQGFAGQPADSAGRRTGNRTSAGPETVLRKACWATGGPDGTASGQPFAEKAGGESPTRSAGQPAGSDETKGGQPRDGTDGGASPDDPFGRPVGLTGRRAGNRPSVRPDIALWMAQRATGGPDGTAGGQPFAGMAGGETPTWPAGKPAGWAERRAGNRATGRLETAPPTGPTGDRRI